MALKQISNEWTPQERIEVTSRLAQQLSYKMYQTMAADFSSSLVMNYTDAIDTVLRYDPNYLNNKRCELKSLMETDYFG